MKKIIIALALAAGTVAITPAISQAQVSFSLNIGSQPLWGPTGYDYAGYYYMPDIDAYYNVGSQQFVYMDGGQWVYRTSLPPRYRNYDLYNSYKVVINDRDPWLRNDYYRRQYRGYRGRRSQAVIRDSRDYRYYEIANHPYHNQWRGPRDGRGRDDRYDRDRRDGRRDSRYDRRDDRGRRGYDNGTRPDGVQEEGRGSDNGRRGR